MTRLRRAAEFLGMERSIAGLLVMVVLVGMGERMAERFLPLYLVAGLGAGIRWPGYVNAIDQLLSALYSFPGGALSDRLGTRRALLVFNLLAMAGYLIVILIPAKEAVLIGSVLFLSWTAISLPASMSLVARVLPRNRRVMGVTMHSLVRRIPMALGPILGGALILRFGEERGVRLAFTCALAMALVALIVQQFTIPDEKPEVPKAVRINPLKVLHEMSPSLRNLLVADILVRFCEQIPYAYLALWCIRETGAVDALQFGTLTAVEMVAAMLVYIPVAYYADRARKKPFVVATFIIFTLFPLVSFWPGRSGFWCSPSSSGDSRSSGSRPGRP
jgi:MFS family permease